MEEEKSSEPRIELENVQTQEFVGPPPHKHHGSHSPTHLSLRIEELEQKCVNELSRVPYDLRRKVPTGKKAVGTNNMMNA